MKGKSEYDQKNADSRYRQNRGNLAGYKPESPRFYTVGILEGKLWRCKRNDFSGGSVYIDENKNEIQGFIGLDEEYIAGIFVWSEAQSRGIGKCLLDWVKEEKRKLTLNVYARNPGAVRFYQREGFRIAGEDTDEDTGEKEYLMCWEAEKDSDSICD